MEVGLPELSALLEESCRKQGEELKVKVVRSWPLLAATLLLTPLYHITTVQGYNYTSELSLKGYHPHNHWLHATPTILPFYRRGSEESSHQLMLECSIW